MNVNELIEALQDLVDNNPEAGELPLRVAYQPNWPLHVRVDAVRVAVAKGADDRPDAPVLYFVAGTCPYGENPYASRVLWDGEGNSLAEDYSTALQDTVDLDRAVEAVIEYLALTEGVNAESVAIVDADPCDDGTAEICLQVDDGPRRHLRWKPDGTVVLS